MTPEKKDALVKELTDGMYDRQSLRDALNDTKELLTTFYIEQIRTQEEQKRMEVVFDELRALTDFLK